MNDHPQLFLSMKQHLPCHLVLACLLLWPSMHSALAASVCGRTAIINNQEILIDTCTTKKGEGLRHYITKDPIAKSYFDQYQEKNQLRWYHALPGTAGTIMTIHGFGQLKSFLENDPKNKQAKIYIIGGVSILILNYLVVKTLEYKYEQLLQNSVEEYNKRNLPKIFFSPIHERGGDGSTSMGVTTGFIKEF